MNFNVDSVLQFLSTRGLDIGLKIIGAILAWIIGRWVIGMVIDLLKKALQRNNKLEPTVIQYIGSIGAVLLTIGLAMGILDMVGIQTASFAALIAGAGLAIGTAWGGLLTHFAAGAFMQVLRPFKIGDFVTAGGITGTVKEMGLFGTTIITGDNVQTVVGNNKVFNDTIQNFSALPHRRVECIGKVANSVDHNDAMARLRVAITQIPNVKEVPKPEVDVLSFTPEGPVIAVRPYCHTDHYWQVYFDTNKAILDTFNNAGYPVPERAVVNRNL
jgi:small conductance mechanosensitive channel